MDSSVVVHQSICLFGLLEVDDASEFLGIEGGTSDQASVDFGHGHELVDTVGSDGSSVLDAGGLGDLIVVHAGQDGSQKGVRLVWNEKRCGMSGWGVCIGGKS